MINGKNGTIEIIVGKKMKSTYSAGEKFLLNENKWEDPDSTEIHHTRLILLSIYEVDTCMQNLAYIIHQSV